MIAYYFGYQWYIIENGNIVSLKVDDQSATGPPTNAIFRRLAKPSPVEVPALDFKIFLQFCNNGNYLIALLSESTFYAKGYLIVWEKNESGEWNINPSFSQEVSNDTIGFAVSNESVIALSTPSTVSFFDVYKKAFIGTITLPRKEQNIIMFSADDTQLTVLYSPTDDSDSSPISCERGYTYQLHNDSLKELITSLDIPGVRLLKHIASHTSFYICEHHHPEYLETGEIVHEALKEKSSLQAFSNKLQFKNCWKCLLKKYCCL